MLVWGEEGGWGGREERREGEKGGREDRRIGGKDGVRKGREGRRRRELLDIASK